MPVHIGWTFLMSVGVATARYRARPFPADGTSFGTRFRGCSSRGCLCGPSPRCRDAPIWRPSAVRRCRQRRRWTIVRPQRKFKLRR